MNIKETSITKPIIEQFSKAGLKRNLWFFFSLLTKKQQQEQHNVGTNYNKLNYFLTIVSVIL